MIELFELVAASFAGGLLGALFFGGLWWTIRRGVLSTQPAVFFLGSLVLRTLIVAAGFYFIAHNDWHKLVASVAGFACARIAVGRRVNSTVEAHSMVLQERAR